MPGRPGKAAIIAYGVLCLAFQLRLSTDWLLRESVVSERPRRAFNIRLYDPVGEADVVFPETQRAGLAKGDRIVSGPGAPAGGSNRLAYSSIGTAGNSLKAFSSAVRRAILASASSAATCRSNSSSGSMFFGKARDANFRHFARIDRW